jgi:hypothetical protein
MDFYNWCKKQARTGGYMATSAAWLVKQMDDHRLYPDDRAEAAELVEAIDMNMSHMTTTDVVKRVFGQWNRYEDA